MIRACASCEWWSPPTYPAVERGVCRGAPPTMHDDEPRWPQTLSDEFCAVWRPREAGHDARQAENERLRGEVSSAERRVSPSGRTEAQSALEFAGYLADAVDAFYAFMCTPDATTDHEAHRGHFRALRSASYEFHKRIPPAESGASVAVATATCAGKDELDDPLSLAEAKASTAEAEVKRLTKERDERAALLHEYCTQSATDWRAEHDRALASEQRLARAVEVLEQISRTKLFPDDKINRGTLQVANHLAATFLASLPKEKTHEG